MTTMTLVGDFPMAALGLTFSLGCALLLAFIALRFVDLPDPCIVTVVDNDKITRRRSNAWRVRKHLEPPEEQCQRYVNYYSRPKVMRESWRCRFRPRSGHARCP